MSEEIGAVDIDLLTEIDNDEESNISDEYEEEIEKLVKPERTERKKNNFNKIKLYIALVLVLILVNLPVINNWISSLPTVLQLVIRILSFLFTFTIFDRFIDF